MRKHILGLSMMALSATYAMATPSIQVLVSFSIPEPLLMATLREAAELHIPATLNGLHENAMPATAKKIITLAAAIPNLSLQIDPTAFERFGITQVPALIVEGQGAFDVLYGNLSLKDGLARIADHGDSGFSTEDLKALLHD